MPTPIRLLIVDDDVPTRIGLRAIFSSESDIQVIGESGDAEDAYRMVEALAPDVVLMDIQLPSSDGIEATKRITAQRGSDSEPPRVIILTTFELNEYVYRSVKAGASGFLLKRAPAEDIVDAVRVAADGSELPMSALARRLFDEFAETLASPSTRAVDALTDRESEVLVLIARGMSNQEIAKRLVISLDTVKSHVKHVFNKLAVRDRAQAVISAYESGLVSPGGS